MHCERRVSDRGPSAQLAFLNRLLGRPDGWADARSLLADLCPAFGLRAAGLRWPADGPPVLAAETAAVPEPAFRAPVPIPQLAAGLFWADGPGTADEAWLRLAANALGHSPAMRTFLGPITEQARLAQRLDDAAKVAGRVAHDLDNVFQGVTGFAALALEDLPEGSSAHSNVREVEASAQHGLKFCGQLHQLSRAGQARPLPASVSAALARLKDRLAADHPGTRVEVDAPADLPPVGIEGGGLQQLLGIVLDNAAEANPKGGAVTVTARAVELAPADLTGFLGCPTAGPHVEVRVTDTGPGLTDEARRRMFVDPFFTTKFRHRGLGLTVAYRMLYAHRGGVQADGRPGQGTTVRVVLPVATTRPYVVEPGRSTGGSPR